MPDPNPQSKEFIAKINSQIVHALFKHVVHDQPADVQALINQYPNILTFCYKNYSFINRSQTISLFRFNPTYRGIDALSFALAIGNSKCFNILLEHAAKIHKGGQILDMFLKQNHDIVYVERDYYTNLNALQFEIKQSKTLTCLQILLKYRAHQQYKSLLENLFTHTYVRLFYNGIDWITQTDFTVLNYAIGSNQPELLQKLLEHATEIDADQQDKAFLKKLFTQTCSFLRTGGCADTNLTILHYATFSGRTECLKILLKHATKIDADQQDKTFLKKLFTQTGSLLRTGGGTYTNLTILHYATLCSRTECLKILLKHATEINDTIKQLLEHMTSFARNKPEHLNIFLEHTAKTHGHSEKLEEKATVRPVEAQNLSSNNSKPNPQPMKRPLDDRKDTSEKRPCVKACTPSF
ncbi:MAG: hypothetical protein CMF51_03935 [Legionellales bacterium]|nr:hypothetical protein [Legionellales bacterium]